MDELSWSTDEGLFSDIYTYDKEAFRKVQLIIESQDCIRLEERARKMGTALPLLDELIPDKKISTGERIRSLISPFYSKKEFSTKEHYLRYLKYAYGFMMTPMEEPPGRILGFFFPSYKRNWSPSGNGAVELLRKFYVEVNLILGLSEVEWRDIASSQNPEARLAKKLYGAEFTGEFAQFLKKIPWILSKDVYSSPGLDLMYWEAPGQKLPKKPFGVDDFFLANLARVSREDKAYVLLTVGNDSRDDSKRIRLKHEDQILKGIERDGTAHVDTFVGISKIERDFVIHQHIALWSNPGYEKYVKASFGKRIMYMKPHRYLCAFREQALPLEIAFVDAQVRK